MREKCAMIPLAIETYGTTHPNVYRFVKLIAKETVDKGLCHLRAGAFPTPKKLVGTLANDIMERLSAALQKGNAHALKDFVRKATKFIKPDEPATLSRAYKDDLVTFTRTFNVNLTS